MSCSMMAHYSTKVNVGGIEKNLFSRGSCIIDDDVPLTPVMQYNTMRNLLFDGMIALQRGGRNDGYHIDSYILNPEGTYVDGVSPLADISVTATYYGNFVKPSSLDFYNFSDNMQFEVNNIGYMSGGLSQAIYETILDTVENAIPAAYKNVVGSQAPEGYYPDFNVSNIVIHIHL